MAYKIQRMKINLRLKFSEESIAIKEQGNYCSVHIPVN